MKNWEIAQDRGWRAVSAQPQGTLTRYSHSFSSKFNDAITAESSNIRTCFFWGPIYKKDNYQPGKSWVVLTDAEDDSLAGLPLYITAGHPSAVLFAHPLGLNLWLPLYISTGHFFEDADSDWLLIKTKCRLWLFAKLNGTTSKQEKWYGSWLSPITKYNKSVIMTSTQWKKSFFLYMLDPLCFLVHLTLFWKGHLRLECIQENF